MPTTQNIARSPRKLALLSAIAQDNAAGLRPSKADLTRGLPTKTRAGHYSLVSDPIRAGLVENTGAGGTYALSITDAGRAAL